LNVTQFDGTLSILAVVIPKRVVLGTCPITGRVLGSVYRRRF